MKSPRTPLSITVSFFSVWLVQAIEVDTSFQASVPNGTVHAIALGPDGSAWIGGEFDSVNGQNVHSLTKLSPTGALDPNGAFSVDGAVFSIALDSAGIPVAPA